MLRARWRTSIRPPFIPPLLVMGSAALLSLAAAQLAAAAPLFRTSAATDCSGAGAAARAHGPALGGRAVRRPEARCQGRVHGPRTSPLPAGLPLSLPADSFVGQPVGDSLVYTLSMAGRSEVHLVDMAAGCDTIVARTAGVARSAILDPTGSAVYVHGVTFPGARGRGSHALRAGRQRGRAGRAQPAGRRAVRPDLRHAAGLELGRQRRCSCSHVAPRSAARGCSMSHRARSRHSMMTGRDPIIGVSAQPPRDVRRVRRPALRCGQHRSCDARLRRPSSTRAGQRRSTRRPAAPLPSASSTAAGIVEVAQ